MLDKIIEILTDICGADEGEILADTELFEEGFLDSFGAIQLVMQLQDEFNAALELANIPRDKLSTAKKIESLLKEELR